MTLHSPLKAMMSSNKVIKMLSIVKPPSLKPLILTEASSPAHHLSRDFPPAHLHTQQGLLKESLNKR